MPPTSDQEFLSALRVVVDRYLVSVDQWEAGYEKYCRLPGYAKAGNELDEQLRQYIHCRRALEAMLPRARRLCFKHQISDALSGLLRISLGQYAPQERLDSAIGRNERAAVTRCLLELSEMCAEWECRIRVTQVPATEPERQSILRKLVNYFY